MTARLQPVVESASRCAAVGHVGWGTEVHGESIRAADVVTAVVLAGAVSTRYAQVALGASTLSDLRPLIAAAREAGVVARHSNGASTADVTAVSALRGARVP